jgi:predicted RNA-binding Zn-ribbon protein involved in translation (DUF1610 family)
MKEQPILYSARPMASNCPNCGDSRAKVIETRQRSQGTVYRRLKCLGCGTRWTTYDAEPPNHDKPKPEPARFKNEGDCLHWRNGCGLGFPDAKGQTFCGFCPAHLAS